MNRAFTQEPSSEEDPEPGTWRIQVFIGSVVQLHSQCLIIFHENKNVRSSWTEQSSHKPVVYNEEQNKQKSSVFKSNPAEQSGSVQVGCKQEGMTHRLFHMKSVSSRWFEIIKTLFKSLSLKHEWHFKKFQIKNKDFQLINMYTVYILKYFLKIVFRILSDCFLHMRIKTFQNKATRFKKLQNCVRKCLEKLKVAKL